MTPFQITSQMRLVLLLDKRVPGLMVRMHHGLGGLRSQQKRWKQGEYKKNHFPHEGKGKSARPLKSRFFSDFTAENGFPPWKGWKSKRADTFRHRPFLEEDRPDRLWRKPVRSAQTGTNRKHPQVRK
ncbi:MAG: hypothetical protein KC553_00245 [Nitrospina sp.]|nr:hypothetical protein [Nitrospina sp.]